MDRFELFHLSLMPRDQRDMFSRDSSQVSREQWLREVFGTEQPFSHHGSDYHYVPIDSSNGPVLGRVGRKVLRAENAPPSEGLEEITHEAWLAALVVIDPTHHDDVQKLAFQAVNDVGNPALLAKRLVTAINKLYPHGPYTIDVGQIIEERSFWEFVEENKGQVVSVVLDIPAPNMFGSVDELTEELKELRDSEKAKNIRIGLHNSDGVQADTSRMKRVVNYTSKSGGRIRARARKNKKFNSKDAVKRTAIDDIKASGAELIKLAKSLANRILGRE